MGDWTAERVMSLPESAAILLNSQQEQAKLANRRINDLLEANNRYLQRARDWEIVEKLRADEGNTVTLVCDNPDFNGQPNAKVICNGDFTDWQDDVFTGDTISEALAKAWAAMDGYRRAT